MLKTQCSELLEKLQAITNEFAVVKSDAEIIKQKARQMLIDKDEELERMRSNKNGGNSAGQAVHGQKNSSPLKDAQDSAAAQSNNQPDSGASTFQEGTAHQNVMEADNSQMME